MVSVVYEQDVHDGEHAENITHTYRHISVQKHIHPLRAMFYSHSDAKVCIRPHSVSIPDKLPFGLLQYLVVVLNVIGYEKDSCE